MSFITIVSGLPRSGTSMMMQMLAAGGVPVLADHTRPPDESNPRGYFEYEPVKRSARDVSWVPLAQGKAVKVIHILLDHLPSRFEYRVLMMKRPIAEILQSQEKMLGRAGAESPRPAGASIPSDRLGRIFQRQMELVELRLESRPEFKILEVDYGECISQPACTARRLADFLGLDLDVAAMQAAVDPSLHRNR